MFDFLKKKKRNVTDIVMRQDFEELKKRTRIVVVDDNEDEFPFKVLRNEGYSIDYWADIKELDKLENAYFDIIILDIGGIGAAYDKDNEGVGILRHIKTVNPSQIVVAYSGQSHESSRIPFFQLADQYIPKPASALTIKEFLDDLIKTKVTIQHFWPCLRKMLEEKGATPAQIKSIDSLLLDTIESKDSSGLEFKVSDILKGLDNISTLASIAGKIVLLGLG